MINRMLMRVELVWLAMTSSLMTQEDWARFEMRQDMIRWQYDEAYVCQKAAECQQMLDDALGRNARA